MICMRPETPCRGGGHGAGLVGFLEEVEDAGVVAVKGEFPAVVRQVPQGDAPVVLEEGGGLVEDALADQDEFAGVRQAGGTFQIGDDRAAASR